MSSDIKNKYNIVCQFDKNSEIFTYNVGFGMINDSWPKFKMKYLIKVTINGVKWLAVNDNLIKTVWKNFDIHSIFSNNSLYLIFVGVACDPN